MWANLSVDIKAPADCTEEQFREWIMYNLKYAASIDLSNPLVDFEFEPDYVEIHELNI